MEKISGCSSRTSAASQEPITESVDIRRGRRRNFTDGMKMKAYRKRRVIHKYWSNYGVQIHKVSIAVIVLLCLIFVATSVALEAPSFEFNLLEFNDTEWNETAWNETTWNNTNWNMTRNETFPTGSPITLSPTFVPTGQPFSAPTRVPTNVPTGNPTRFPTGQPSNHPTVSPTAIPTLPPTQSPSSQPTAPPTDRPTTLPTNEPSSVPTNSPIQPTRIPTNRPTQLPTNEPSVLPTKSPIQPTGIPTRQPTFAPTFAPTRSLEVTTNEPSSAPTNSPIQPTSIPTSRPTQLPTNEPSVQPTKSPIQPTGIPTRQPTFAPTFAPTRSPEVTLFPTSSTEPPSRAPTSRPSRMPTSGPTNQPTRRPTLQPSPLPTPFPTLPPTTLPTRPPTLPPTILPTSVPTTRNPTNAPTMPPTNAPSSFPTVRPTGSPSRSPTAQPSRTPSASPSRSPSASPTAQPSRLPSSSPSSVPTKSPSVSPSLSPTFSPSVTPSQSPTVSHQPSVSQVPSLAPTPVYEFDNAILSLRSGRCILSGVTFANETEPIDTQGNETVRFLQDDSELSCNKLWETYVHRGIETEISLIISQVETLKVTVANVTREYNAENNLLIFLFDVEVAIRSPLNEHFLNRYVAGPFDSRTEQEDFVRYLRNTGCPEFSSLTGVRFVLPAPPSASQVDSRSEPAQAGLIAGLVAALAAASILVGVFLFVRLRRDPGPIPLEDEGLDPSSGRVGNEIVSEVGIRTNAEVSTLGDPFPQGSSPGGGGDASTVDSHSLDYDFQKAFMQPSPSTVSGSRSGGESMSQLLVDDDTLEAHYQAEERVEVDAPPGVLGLVLETSVDGIPVVNAIKPSSVLAASVRIGDRLLSVDGHDVSVMLASDVSKLIASKKERPVRKFVFSRPTSQLYGFTK